MIRNSGSRSTIFLSHQQPLDTKFSFWPGFFASVLSTAFGANAVAIKMSLLGLGPFTAAGLRLAMASLVIILWAGAAGRTLQVDRKQIQPLVILTFLTLLQLSLLYLGISRTNASRASLIVNLDPFFILLLAHFFISGDRITVRKFLGILIAFSGVALVFLPKEGVSENLRTGDVITLLSTVVWSSRTVYLKRVIHSFHPFHTVFYPMIFSVPFLFLGGWLLDKPQIGQADWTVLAALLYQVGVASLGWVAWYSLLQKHGAVALHSFMFISPIAGVLLGGVILGEPLTRNLLVALVLIICGILTVQSRKRQPPEVSGPGDSESPRQGGAGPH
jgi:drug/metabolite transporter (DMT)-like permease